MYRFSKKTEYAILALQYIASRSDERHSAKQISEYLNISFEFISKILQKLNRENLLTSHQGINGGYELAKNPNDLTVSDIIRAIEENSSIVECMKKDNTDNCGRSEDCTIKGPMARIQKRIDNVFAETSIADLSDYNNKIELKIK